MNLDQPGDPVDQNAGLSGPCAGQHQNVLITRRDRFTLRIVELVE